MRRLLFLSLLTAGLMLATGCFNRSTEPEKVKDKGAVDRLKETGNVGKEKAGQTKANKEKKADKGGGGLAIPDD
jgi:hypothetical protein